MDPVRSIPHQRAVAPSNVCLYSRIPFRPTHRSEQSELSSAEQAASESWQRWKDAKKEGSAVSEAEVQRLLDDAEAKADALKGLQSLC